ncbi:hypothetical protein [Candidatus Villigracilis affinis]|uniref:hypothetical protein n=1 Tax=Candidatus Villigracilis affinis TaxID=3140682 RepID=UPI001E01144A|nr:hypothetical protein [Anaerolineales bacterium]
MNAVDTRLVKWDFHQVGRRVGDERHADATLECAPAAFNPASPWADRCATGANLHR